MKRKNNPMISLVALLLMIALLVAVCSGCNMAVGLGNFNFKKIHVDTYHHDRCFTVEKWHNDTSGIEVLTEEAGALFLSEGTYMLIDEECPFCEKEA